MSSSITAATPVTTAAANIAGIPTAKRIRILFHITEFNDGGIESAIIQWLKILDRRRFDVALSIMHSSPAFENRYRATIPSDVPVTILVDRPLLSYFQARRHQRHPSKAERIARDVHNLLAVRPYVKKRTAELAARFDVIVDFDMSLRRLSGQFGVIWLGINHFSFNARLGGRPRRVRRLLPQYQRYDGVGTLNQHMADEAGQIFDGQLKQIIVLPNAIDIEFIRARAALSSDFVRTLPADVPYIVSVARLDEIQKDHRTLLQAYAALQKHTPVAEHLVIVGDGAYRQELTQLAQDLDIGTQVHFAGHQDNPLPIVAGASALVLSSKYEGMPMVLLEALAIGKAIISTDCPTGPREILDDGKAGMLVPVGDVTAMADALSLLLASPDARRASSEKALTRAAFYGIQESNRRLLAFLESTADARALAKTTHLASTL